MGANNSSREEPYYLSGQAVIQLSEGVHPLNETQSGLTFGKTNLTDITRMIDYVYISRAELCCSENGNTDGDIDGKVNLADITRLIDQVYISKQSAELCE